MMFDRKRSVISLTLLLALSLGAQEASRQAAKESAPQKVSQFGRYSGFSEAAYDGSVRTSQYLTMRDGVGLAIDIVRPAKNGKPEVKPLPVLWTHNRYRRAFEVKGRLITIADSPDIRNLLRYGYVAASVDSRGSGASFGKALGVWTPEETQDAYEITEWLAKQPWCDGKIGMFGGSYLGITQIMAASRKPPHLKAIFPVVPLFDLYDIENSGGVVHDDMIKTWSELTRLLDTETTAVPVDNDKGGVLLKKAVDEHKANRSLISILAHLKYRNSLDEVTGARPYLEWCPAGHIREINEAGIPMYIWGGWFGAFDRDTFLIYANFTGPKRLTAGAWSHSPKDADIVKEEFTTLAVEEHRWFDYWLKGIDNGIMTEPPIHYQVMLEAKKNFWKTASQWPVPEAKSVDYYFGKGRSGSVSSINDGFLAKTSPSGSTGRDSYRVDYGTTTGTTTRWDNAVGGGFGYPDMSTNDAKGLTYTTAPLTGDVVVTGHPIVRLWASSTATDGTFFAYLEDVDKDGTSRYISEGAVKTSFRALSDPPYDNLRLPYHRSYDTDVSPLKPGEIVELAFDLEPTSKILTKGSRLRLTITCADKDNVTQEATDPPPTVTVYRNSAHMSLVSLPIASTSEVETTARFSLISIFFIVLVIIVLVIAFTLFMRSRMKKK